MTIHGGLDDRKKKILRAIIDDYIQSAEPIGSRSITKKHELGFSSATIRNEMADLEDMGYLDQPYTSAGRVPSDKGYRFYVDELIKLKGLSKQEIESIKMAMNIKINELNQIIKQASKLMSEITNYTSLATTPQMKKTIIKAIQLVPIDKGKALLILVTNVGFVRNSLIRVKESIEADYLIKISNILNSRLSGITIEEVNIILIKEIEREIGREKDILSVVLDELVDCIRHIENTEVYLEGTTNIFKFPEYKNVLKAQEFLSILEEKKIVNSLMRYDKDSKILNVQIGNENEIKIIKGCSLVTATYSFGDMVIGSIGIIGPTRMEYGKVISTVEYIRKKINEEINNFIDEELD
ncbi:MAG: heat-inducible transcriptional repressor HrcA [Clostridiales bacterium]